MAVLQEMDDAAVEAENELSDIPDELVTPVANWMKRWYMKAGYKRLGKILIESAEQG